MNYQQYSRLLTTNNLFHSENLPRKLNPEELGILLKHFPQNSPYYTSYINLLKNWYICKIDNSDPVKLFLCNNGSVVPDLFVMRVVNIAGINIENHFYDFTFFEDSGDTVRIEISIETSVKREYSLAKWQPGDNSPFGGDIKSVEINKDDYFLLLDITKKKVWVHDRKSSGNIILAVTGFYNSVINIQNIKDPKVAFNFDLLFTEKFGIDVLTKAFFLHAKKNKIPGIKVEIPEVTQKEKPKFWKRLFQ